MAGVLAPATLKVKTMLDLTMLRKQLPEVVARLATRNFVFPEKEFNELEAARKTVQTKTEDLQQKRNVLSRQIGMAKKNGEDASALMAEAAQIPEELTKLEAELDDIRTRLNDMLLRIPNLPHESVPVGKDESENVEVRRWGTPREFDFDFKPHWDLGTDLDILDFERGNKLSGSRFTVLGGAGARLERALINFFLDTHTSRGFKEWWPPIVVKRQTMFGTGQLPKFEDDAYHVSGDNFLIPTAEVVLTNLHAGEVLDADTLPRRYTAFTPCFREEAGSAGRDTRGIIRQHEFDKVEMVKFAKPEESDKELESMTAEAEFLLQQLGLPYRVISLCTGDLGFSARQTYDVEVWLPSYNAYKEISSCSNCGDFQARRANIKYRDPENFKGSRYLHTLNGSGLPAGRTMAAILENYQNADGTITIPEVLRPYMGGLEKIEPVA